MNPQNVKKIFDHQSYYLAPAVFESKQLERMTDSFNQIASALSNNEQANNARWSGAQMDALDGGESVVLHTHNIQNIGDEDLITVFWTNEHYNEDTSDTYLENV